MCIYIYIERERERDLFVCICVRLEHQSVLPLSGGDVAELDLMYDVLCHGILHYN